MGVKKIRRAIFIVVYTQTKQGIKYLILKRKLHWKGWEFPKGKVENFEIFNKKKTALREVEEETGLKPLKKTLKKYKVSGRYLYKLKLKDRSEYAGQTYTLFSVEVPFSKKLKFDKKEHSSGKWVTFRPASKMLTWQNQKKCLKIVNKEIQ